MVATIGYSQIIITTEKQDKLNFQKARIAALDAQYTAQTNQLAAQHIMQRNDLLRQLDRINSQTNGVSTISSQPTSTTPSN
jgi:hypothetical protein